jgi:hypothetical protein
MAAATAPVPVIRPFANGMRSPVVAPVTRGILGVSLFVFAASTATAFAWTIEPPLTAAVLGANYLSSVALAIIASQERVWAYGRVSISVALVFAPVTTAATFLHLGLFHIHSSGFALVIAWFWIVAYALYPLQLVVNLVKQLRTPGTDPPRTRPLPLWVRVLYGGHAVVLIPLGVLMFLRPDLVRNAWPWTVPDLSMQALSAWVLAFGVLAVHVLRENDLRRIRCVLLGYPVFVLAHVVALVRFGSVVVWSRPGAWVYVAYLATGVVLGAYGWAKRDLLRPERWVDVGKRAATFTA